MTKSRYKALVCAECETSFDTNQLQSFCPNCKQPLVAIYDLRNPPLKFTDFSWSRDSMWYYREFLPILDEKNIITLGEGLTKIISLSKISKRLDLKHEFFMKDEGTNPTGSFKARGMSAAISKARELGVWHCCTPTAGNAGSALAAYCAKADMQSSIFMPQLTPEMFRFDCELMGARVVKVDGSIRDAGLEMQKQNLEMKAWDVSTMKEPFRLEGKKTMGYEIAAQFNYQLPDYIFYPTGGGTGLIGIWKAFEEMQEMGWLDEISTRMVAVQMTGCAPVVEAFEARADVSKGVEDPAPTAANGLRVPKAFGDKMILKAIYKSKGFAISVQENEMLAALNRTAREEGLFLSPEGAALIAAVEKCLSNGVIEKESRILIINTGTGYKYAENLW
ncbi:MAG: threonine synthase [Saprospiraceae bacterium]|nr:threonine synthase [Saprospiraceae bacterium]